MKIIVLLVFSLAVCAQSKSGSATTGGSCSPANTGNSNTFNITCGIGKEQGDVLLQIVNTILANQLDPGAVMAKLDEIKTGVDEIRKANAPRRLSPAQQASLVQFLSAVAKPKVTVMIKNGNAEVADFKNDFLAVFKALNWEVKGPIIDLEPSSARGINVIVRSQNEHPRAAEVLTLYLRQLGFTVETGPNTALAVDEFRLVIASKP